jgi:uncharacterized protein YhhL (DUF1145 family)
MYVNYTTYYAIICAVTQDLGLSGKVDCLTVCSGAQFTEVLCFLRVYAFFFSGWRCRNSVSTTVVLVSKNWFSNRLCLVKPFLQYLQFIIHLCQSLYLLLHAINVWCGVNGKASQPEEVLRLLIFSSSSVIFFSEFLRHLALADYPSFVYPKHRNVLNVFRKEWIIITIIISQSKLL